MTWQGRVDVGDDLTRLHRSSRAADMSRDLGYSSISMGEGSLDLIVGDDPENVRARYGDQPDGRFGIGLWHRGGMKYLPDVLESAEDRITGTEQKNTQQDGRLDGHDADVDRIDAKNGEQDGRLTGAEGRLNGVEGRMGDAEGRLDGHDGRLSGLDGDVDRIDSKNSAQDDAIALKAAASALAAAVARIAALEGQDNASASSVSALDDKLDARVAQLMTAIRLVASRSNQPDPFA